MNLLNLPLRMVARQGRWIARGTGFIVAGAVFEYIRRHEQIQLPGMDIPYDTGLTDPYWMSVLAYLVVTWFLKRAVRILIRGAGAHIQRVSRGDWF